MSLTAGVPISLYILFSSHRHFKTFLSSIRTSVWTLTHKFIWSHHRSLNHGLCQMINKVMLSVMTARAEPNVRQSTLPPSIYSEEVLFPIRSLDADVGDFNRVAETRRWVRVSVQLFAQSPQSSGYQTPPERKKPSLCNLYVHFTYRARCNNRSQFFVRNLSWGQFCSISLLSLQSTNSFH